MKTLDIKPHAPRALLDAGMVEIGVPDRQRDGQDENGLHEVVAEITFETPRYQSGQFSKELALSTLPRLQPFRGARSTDGTAADQLLGIFIGTREDDGAYSACAWPFASVVLP